MESKLYTIVMTVITIYALFGDDIRIVACPVSADIYFSSVTIVCIFFFSLEIILASIVKHDYFIGFYFWLDLIATASLIFDVGFVWDYV
jgi:hypothetical protein